MLKIGELSKLSRVSIRMLRHYDDKEKMDIFLSERQKELSKISQETEYKAGLFDRLFIDWWWVGHTKAWIIPGTEEFIPYIYGKTLVGKWVGTLIGFPILAAIISGVITLLT